MKETVYTSDSQLRSPRIFFRDLIDDLPATREIGWRFFVHNLRSQYRRSWLGYLWLIIPPLMTTLVWAYLNRVNLLNISTPDIPYPVYVLTGTFLWQAFIEALNAPLQQLQSSRWILTKVKAPHEAFILAGLGAVIFNLMVRTLILFAAFIYFGIPLHATIFLFPLGSLSLIAVGLAIGILITPVGLLYTDVSGAINVMTTFWFFITPIIYSAAGRSNGLAIVKYNPVTPLLVTTRNWLTNGTIAPASGFFLVTMLSLIVFLCGWIFFRLSKPHIIVRLSN